LKWRGGIAEYLWGGVGGLQGAGREERRLELKRRRKKASMAPVWGRI